MPTWDMVRFKDIQKRWYEGFWGKGWNSQFLNNHDHTRQVTRYGNDQEYRVQSAKLLATMVHTLPGAPYIYQGEEIGMTGVKYPHIDDYKDIAFQNKFKEETDHGEDPEAVLERLRPLARDNSRSPMQWSDAPNAGFSSGNPWIKINPNYKEINVEKDLAEPNSIYTYYQKLIALRKKNAVMIYGEYNNLSDDHASLYVYTRGLNDTQWLVILNFADHETLFTLDENFDDSNKKLILANYPDVREEDSIISVRLRAHEARIYEI
jgi:oligo-1,6-glucosidase